MAKGKRTGASHSGYYASYKAGKRWEKNRLKKLARALKRNPGNEAQINAAMGNLVYRRKTPTTGVWSATTRRVAQLFKLAVGLVPKEALMQQMPKGKEAEAEYWKGLNAVKAPPVKVPTVNAKLGMFSLGARANFSVPDA